MKNFLIDKNRPILNKSELELFVRWANGRNTTKSQDFYGLGSEWYEFAKKHFKESKEFYSPEGFCEKKEITFFVKRTVDGKEMIKSRITGKAVNSEYILIELKMKIKDNELIPVQYKETLKNKVVDGFEPLPTLTYQPEPQPPELQPYVAFRA